MCVQQSREHCLGGRRVFAGDGAQAPALPDLDRRIVREQEFQYRELRSLGLGQRAVAALHVRERPVRIDRVPQRFSQVGERPVDGERQVARRHGACVDPLGRIDVRLPRLETDLAGDFAPDVLAGEAPSAARSSSSSWGRWLALTALSALASPAGVWRAARSVGQFSVQLNKHPVGFP